MTTDSLAADAKKERTSRDHDTWHTVRNKPPIDSRSLFFSPTGHMSRPVDVERGHRPPADTKSPSMQGSAGSRLGPPGPRFKATSYSYDGDDWGDIDDYDEHDKNSTALRPPGAPLVMQEEEPRSPDKSKFDTPTVRTPFVRSAEIYKTHGRRQREGDKIEIS